MRPVILDCISLDSKTKTLIPFVAHRTSFFIQKFNFRPAKEGNNSRFCEISLFLEYSSLDSEIRKLISFVAHKTYPESSQFKKSKEIVRH